MASGSGDQPPALPVKKHRSSSSRCSSGECDIDLFSPCGPNYSHNDVFPEPTDCHAAQCPIHQRYDPSQHQTRFFSDGTPPPVPKKRLARTLSLPVAQASLLSSLPPPSPLQRQPQNFDNPLYMLAPIPDTLIYEETEDFQPVRESPVPPPSLSQLSFNTPDEDLTYIFGSCDNQRAVFQGVQHRQLVFLRRVAESLESGILLQREATEGGISSYQPQDFVLCGGWEEKQVGNNIYYSVQNPGLPGRVFALRVHKTSDDTSSAYSEQLSHVNLRDVVAHFQPRNNHQNDSCESQTRETPLKSNLNTATPQEGDIRGCMSSSLCSAQSFLQRGHKVSIERDLPHATLEDFVQESHSQLSEDCLASDRRICLLLLQVLTGVSHLYNISASATSLKPQEIFLVWSRRGEEEKSVKGTIKMLWKTFGCPRVVLTPLSSPLSAPHLLPYIKSQIIALIQYCFNSKESVTSSYQTALLHLCSLLQSERTAPQLPNVVVMLQVLLWGPHVPLYNQKGFATTAIHNWLMIKRALLMMKFAERGLMQERSDLDWEDFLCLQYLSFTDPEILESMAGQIWLTGKSG